MLNASRSFELSKMMNLSRTASAYWRGAVFEWHDSLPSTQKRARELANNADVRAVIVADAQTQGRGRLERRWESPSLNGLYFSALFSPRIAADETHLVNIAAAMAVLGALKTELSLAAEIKWPNDVLLNERKVCGILSEAAFHGAKLAYCITGIGLNLNRPDSVPAEIEHSAVWLNELTGRQIDGLQRQRILTGVLRELGQLLGTMEAEGAAHLLGDYRRQCASVGRLVRVDLGGETLTAPCTGIGEHGELIVHTASGPRSFTAADVTHATLVQAHDDGPQFAAPSEGSGVRV